MGGRHALQQEGIMAAETATETSELVTLYRRAFEHHRSRALWTSVCSTIRRPKMPSWSREPCASKATSRRVPSLSESSRFAVPLTSL